jgi:hypothetical protein
VYLAKSADKQAADQKQQSPLINNPRLGLSHVLQIRDSRFLFSDMDQKTTSFFAYWPNGLKREFD